MRLPVPLASNGHPIVNAEAASRKLAITVT
jgi:hypothetical protein